MQDEEKQAFIYRYGFDPGECECALNEADGDMVEITECHAKLLDRFVEQCETLTAYILQRERYNGELELRLSIVDPSFDVDEAKRKSKAPLSG